MRWLVFIGLVIAVDSAAVYSRQRADIPVKVVYDKSAVNYLRNLHAKEQKDEIDVGKVVYGVKNLEARSQLSPEELELIGKEISKVSPLTKIVTPDGSGQSQSFVLINNKDDELRPTFGENIDAIYQQIQEIVVNGITQLKTVADDGTFGEHRPEIMSRVNATLEKFLLDTKKNLELRDENDFKQEQQQQNFIQQMISNFQNITGGFIQTFTNPTGQNDEQPPNPIQGIFTQIQNGLQQFVGQFNNPGTQSTVLGDNPTTPAGPVQFVQNAVQQFQQGVSNLFQPTQAPGASGDDATTQGGPIQFIQSAIQQIQQNIPNPFQPTTKQPAAQGDAPTTPGRPGGFIQQAGQQVVQALQPLNPFNQQPTAKPGQGDATTAQPNNPIQIATGIGQQIASGISSANPIQGGGAGGNPIQGVIDQANQFNPLNQNSPNNPAQGFIDQANQAAGNIPIVGQIQGAIGQGGNPIEAGQSIASQIGQAVQGANPAQLIGQIAQGSQKDALSLVEVPEVIAEVVEEIPQPQPEVVAPENVAPEPVAPIAVAPIVAAPTVAAPIAVTPIAIVPERLAPEVIAPEGVAPEAVAPEAIAPEAVAPEAIAPDVASAEAILEQQAEKIVDAIFEEKPKKVAEPILEQQPEKVTEPILQQQPEKVAQPISEKQPPKVENGQIERLPEEQKEVAEPKPSLNAIDSNKEQLLSNSIVPEKLEKPSKPLKPEATILPAAV